MCLEMAARRANFQLLKPQLLLLPTSAISEIPTFTSPNFYNLRNPNFYFSQLLQSQESQLLLLPASANLNNANFYSRSELFPITDDKASSRRDRGRPRARARPTRSINT